MHIALLSALHLYSAYLYVYAYKFHFAGAEVILRHIRNGVELDPIDFNHNFDFDYQQINFIKRVTILPVSN